MPDLVLGSTTVMSESGGEISSTFFGLKSMQSFTSTGTYAKPAHINTIRVFITGSGGGGGGGGSSYNSGGAGGAGGTAIKLIDVSGKGRLIMVINSSSSSEDGKTCELKIKLFFVFLREQNNSFIVLQIVGSS